MRVLLDTNVLLWAATDERRLSHLAREALHSLFNERFLSAVTPWELAIKLSTRTWDLGMPLTTLLGTQMDALLLTELPIASAHALRVLELPYIHRDPFDRMLIAQALVEGMAVVTTDGRFADYGVEVIW